MVELVRRITVPATESEVWQFVTHLPSVFPCIPGAELGLDLGDGKYEATIATWAGEFGVKFSGVASIDAIDERTAVLRASGSDKLGTIRSQAEAHVHVEALDNGTSALEIRASFDFSGVLAPAARIGSGPAAKLLMQKFGACLVAHFKG